MRTRSEIVPRTYELLRRAVAEGIELGWNRARKHDDHPSQSAIKDRIFEGIMSRIDEDFIFPDPYEDK